MIVSYCDLFIGDVIRKQRTTPQLSWTGLLFHNVIRHLESDVNNDV